jgi:hypothetical protein
MEGTEARTAKPEVKTRFSNTTTRRRISYLRCLMYLTSSTGEDYRVITFVALYDLFSCFDIVVFCSFYVFHLLPFSSTICIYSCEFAIFRLVTGTWVTVWWKSSTSDEKPNSTDVGSLSDTYVLEIRVFTSGFAVRASVRLFLFTAVFVLLLWCLAGTSLLTLENINWLFVA